MTSSLNIDANVIIKPVFISYTLSFSKNILVSISFTTLFLALISFNLPVPTFSYIFANEKYYQNFNIQK